MMKANKSFLYGYFIVLFFTLLAGCKDNDNIDCDKRGILIYIGSGGACNHLIEVDNKLFEPINLNDYPNFIVTQDSQTVRIDFIRENSFASCGAVDQVSIVCLEPL